MKNKFFPIIILSFSFLLWSCADEPNDTGSLLIPENDKLNTTVYSSITENIEQSLVQFQEDSLFWGSSDRLLLGNYKNLKSEILISFQIVLPDSIKSELESNDSTKLIDSWIELYPNYWIGDSTNFAFTAQKINSHWNSVFINDDSIAEIKASLGPDLIQSFEYEPGDTVIKFRIGNEIVDEWVNITLDDALPVANGILLSPTNSNGMVGFQALTSFPSNFYPGLYLVFEKTNSFVDTVLTFPRIDIHIVEGEVLPELSNSIYLQGSISSRGRLFFNLETLPENILINSANLELFVDDFNTFQGTIKSDTIAASFYHNFESDSIRYDYGKYPLLQDGEKFSGELRQFVQRWVDGDPNEGLELKLADENRSPAAVSIFNSNHPDINLRPRLTIYYTK